MAARRLAASHWAEGVPQPGREPAQQRHRDSHRAPACARAVQPTVARSTPWVRRAGLPSCPPACSRGRARWRLLLGRPSCVCPLSSPGRHCQQILAHVQGGETWRHEARASRVACRRQTSCGGGEPSCCQMRGMPRNRWTQRSPRLHCRWLRPCTARHARVLSRPAGRVPASAHASDQRQTHAPAACTCCARRVRRARTAA